MSQNFLHRQQCIAEGITVFLGNLLIRIKPNTHRRFLRTELIERRCPPEVIDAFLGHWQQGEEPYGPFSSFSARSYVETLRTYLEPLLAEIGLTHAIASRIAP